MTRVNLIPPGVQRSQIRRGHLKRWAASLAAVVTAVGVSLTVEGLRQVEANDLRAQKARLQEELESTRREARDVTAEASGVLERIERAKALRGKRTWSALFSLIDSCLPNGCWLTQVASDPATPGSGPQRLPSRKVSTEPMEPPPPVTIEAPHGVRLSGYATEAAEPLVLVSNLETTGVFANVTLAQSQREPALDGLYYRFELVCEWGP